MTDADAKATEAKADDVEASETDADTTDADTTDVKDGGSDKADDSKGSDKADDSKGDDEDTKDDGDSADTYGISMDKVEAVLSKSADENAMTPQMRKMFARQQESTKRVEESIKGTKSNPSWFVPVFCALLIIGLVWVVVFYMTGKYPIPGIDNWNLAIGFAIMLVGFLMTMWWH
ncbi:cell division protein CrgA [Bifidobacterium catulorum]|uniref:cell division protein CrgA n=1 Tax=Bifidobacterium catulorum TaxID=1630173 RepID=UPI001F4DC01A|nr:cell division protein CrgA [Bifidobacterium catulorum]